MPPPVHFSPGASSIRREVPNGFWPTVGEQHAPNGRSVPPAPKGAARAMGDAGRAVANGRGSSPTGSSSTTTISATSGVVGRRVLRRQARTTRVFRRRTTTSPGARSRTTTTPAARSRTGTSRSTTSVKVIRKAGRIGVPCSTGRRQDGRPTGGATSTASGEDAST